MFTIWTLLILSPRKQTMLFCYSLAMQLFLLQIIFYWLALNICSIATNLIVLIKVSFSFATKLVALPQSLSQQILFLWLVLCPVAKKLVELPQGFTNLHKACCLACTTLLLATQLQLSLQ